tara:strand:- start:80 stop:526 length:447 start_codon:yes stop_codon:yes gene_type:complete
LRLAKTKNLGFTLIELLVVVAILGIISAIGTLSYQGYVGAAKKKSAQNVLMQAALGQLEYFSDNNSYYVADKCTMANAKAKATGFDTGTTSYKLQDALLGGQDNFNEDLGYYGCVGEDTDGYTLFAVEKSGNCVIAMNSNKEFSFQDC